MNCELCHQHPAEVAITVEKKGGEEELYVCKACAKREHVAKQKKSQRTRKVVEISGSDATPLIEALMGAVDGLFGALGDTPNSPDAKPADARTYNRIPTPLHLEGLSILGDLESVHRAMRALDMRLSGIDADGIHDAGHLYHLEHTGSSSRAKRVLDALLEQERHARTHLFNEEPRLLTDAICRALAILKNCRLLTPAELFDLLSPLQLAIQSDLLDGITKKELASLAHAIDLSSREDDLDPDERYRIEATRADEINVRFEDVVLNERAELLGREAN